MAGSIIPLNILKRSGYLPYGVPTIPLTRIDPCNVPPLGGPPYFSFWQNYVVLPFSALPGIADKSGHKFDVSIAVSFDEDFTYGNGDRRTANGSVGGLFKFKWEPPSGCRSISCGVEGVDNLYGGDGTLIGDQATSLADLFYIDQTSPLDNFGGFGSSFTTTITSSGGGTATYDGGMAIYGPGPGAFLAAPIARKIDGKCYWALQIPFSIAVADGIGVFNSGVQLYTGTIDTSGSLSTGTAGQMFGSADVKYAGGTEYDVTGEFPEPTGHARITVSSCVLSES